MPKAQKNKDYLVCQSLLTELKQNQSSIICSNYSRNAVFQFVLPTQPFPWEILKNKKLFANKPPPQIAYQDHLLIFFHRSSCEVHIGKKIFSVDNGSILYLQPGVKHSICISREAKTGPAANYPMVYYFRFRFKTPQYHPIPPFYFHIPKAASLSLYREKLYVAFRNQKSANEFLIRGLLLSIFGHAFHLLTQQENPRRLSNGQCLRLLQFLRTNRFKIIKVADLAKHLTLSKKYFRMLFQNTYKTCARDWILAQRMTLAGLHIQQFSANISEIAQKMGYENTYLFSKHFKRAMGQSPLSYRKTR